MQLHALRIVKQAEKEAEEIKNREVADREARRLEKCQKKIAEAERSNFLF